MLRRNQATGTAVSLSVSVSPRTTRPCDTSAARARISCCYCCFTRRSSGGGGREGGARLRITLSLAHHTSSARGVTQLLDASVAAACVALFSPPFLIRHCPGLAVGGRFLSRDFFSFFCWTGRTSLHLCVDGGEDDREEASLACEITEVRVFFCMLRYYDLVEGSGIWKLLDRVKSVATLLRSLHVPLVFVVNRMVSVLVLWSF